MTHPADDKGDRAGDSAVCWTQGVPPLGELLGEFKRVQALGNLRGYGHSGKPLGEFMGV